MAGATSTRTARISDDAVHSRTGKTWSEWFAILDAAGGAQMAHKEVVAYLRDQHGVGPWWQQAVTVAYEQARQGREVHQIPEGYQVSVTKTLSAPVGLLWQAWVDERLRRRWLPNAAFTVHKATPEKSLRITLEDGQGTVEVLFYSKGASRSQLTVQQSRLPDAHGAEQAKAAWRERLERLKAMLEVKETP